MKMISLVMILYWGFSLFAFASGQFESGLYLVQESNNSSTCPQQIYPKRDKEGQLIKLVVYYEGDCGSQGPYVYACTSETFCGDLFTQTFEINQEGGYSWANVTYNIWAKLIKE